ncbi:MAG TPA: TerC family protein [Verrucomicrobiota bacterium]|nr:TerC family protein [Verrucomicrobiota bacterium]HNU51205.1 TerC family protein [Verrucomicrobiota bacterium]
MLAVVQIQWWHWAGFLTLILFFLALDLGVFHRKARVVQFREALGWTATWFTVAMGFAGFLVWLRGRSEATDFIQGYLIELSLSMDNVFVIAVIFSYFRVPSQYQHRVLFWGILGALVMRGVMIWLGAELIHSYEWVLYIFGAFLVLTGLKMLLGSDAEEVHPERNPVLRLARRYFPVTDQYDGQRFFTWKDGGRALTPLALVLLMVETTDLVFALDSIPAIFGVTTDPFIVFTSNVFAILGLRSLYFVLAGMIAYFRYLKYGLAIILAFIGFKMLIVDWVKIPSETSLLVVVGVLLGSILVSILAARRRPVPEPEPPDRPRPS